MLRALLVFGFVFSFSSLAKPDPKSEFPELLSSRQLLALTPARRMAYFIKIRKMMVELSAMSAKGKGTLVAINDIEPSRLEQIMNLLLAPAYAAQQCNDPTYPIDLGGVCARPCMIGAPQSASEQAQAVNNVSFCFKAPLAKRSVRTDLRFDNAGFDTHRPFNEIAPKLEALTNSRAQEIKQRISSPPLAVGTPPLGANERPTAGADNGPSGRNTAAEARQAARSAQLTVGTQPLGPGETRTAGLPDSPSGPSTRRQCKREGDVYSRFSDACVAEETYKQQLVDYGQEKKDATTAEQIVATNGTGTPCKAPSVVCSDKESYRKNEREKALEEFRKDSPNTCVYAGNMSTYANKKVEANNCSKVSDFCISKSKEACDKPSPEGYGNDFQLKYKCEGGKTLCSPFIFGLERPNKALCVPARGKFVTEACDEVARKSESKEGSTYVKDFLGRAPTGVAEAWDEYAEAFNKACRDNLKSMAAHCEECKIIGQRLKEANLLALGSCESAVKYHERSGKPADSTTTK